MTRRRLPPLNPLRNFEAAARAGSFAAAAEELNVTAVAVSRQVVVLETYFDTLLFIRHANTIELSPAGRRLLPSVSAALDQLAEGARQLRQPDARTVVLCTYQAFAMCWLIPRLKHFTAANPDINLSLTTAATPAEFDGAQADIRIRYGRENDDTYAGKPILPDIVVPVCSPGVQAGPHPLPPLDNLARHTLLRSRYRRLDWPNWLDVAGAAGIQATRELDFKESGLANQAAAQGLGVAIAQRLLVDRELAEGILVQPFDIALRRADDIWMSRRLGPRDGDPTAQVARWIEAEAQDTLAGFGIDFIPADFERAQSLLLPSSSARMPGP